jgi:hypothetical protein
MMNIKPIDQAGSYRTGGLTNMTVAKINKILGFKPNVEDDPYKVENSWGFTADGEECGVWDYKRSGDYGQFSTYGPNKVFVELFGKNYVSNTIEK